MVRIKDIFKKDIGRKINGVVKADQNTEDVVLTELTEYVVTEELTKHFHKFFDRYVSSFNSPTEDIGVWISGFYGSGKSHFLKMLGRIIENKEYAGKRVSDYFDEKIHDGIIQGNIKKASEIPTDVLLFNVDNVSDQDSYNNKDSITVAFLKNFNGYFGFSKENMKVAEFERMLWDQGRLEEFIEKIEEETGTTWKEVIRNLDFHQDSFIDVVEDMGIMSMEAADRWMLKDNNILISPEGFADLLEAYFEKHGNDRRIIFLVDEIGQYIGDNSQLMLNLQTLVEVLGVRFKGKVWVCVTSQQDLGNIISEGKHRKNDFSKIQDRFKTMLSLSSSNIDEVIKKRLLEKKDIDKLNLQKIYTTNIINMKNIINFSTNEMILPIYNSDIDFSETYPFVGYQFTLLQKVYEKVRDMGYSGQHMSRGERSLLSSFQEAAVKMKDKEVGSLVPFNYFFDSIEQFLEDIAKRPFQIAVNERGIDEFGLEVLKLLFLLKGIPGIEPNVNNLISFMIDSVDCDRVALEGKIKDALRELEKQVLIEKDGDFYYFLTNEEQDINKEISNEEFEFDEIYKEIDDCIFGSIFTKNTIISQETGNKYSFNRKIDEVNRGVKGGQLDITIFTPYSDEFDKISLLGLRGAEYEVILRLPKQQEDYLDEIKMYLKVEKYIRRKNLESQRDSIVTILGRKQKENSSRRKRIKAAIEQAILNADLFINGQKKELPSFSDPGKVIEKALQNGAEYRFSSAKLLVRPYEENDIRNVLSYSYDKNVLFDTVKEMESNPNKEAIKAVLQRIGFCEKTGKTVTLKTLVDDFGNKPYGWGVFSVNGLIAELWVYNLIELEEAKEKISKAEDVKQCLTKSQPRNLEKIVVILKEDVDPNLVTKVNNLIIELFGTNCEFDKSSPKESVLDILEKKKNIASIYLKDCKTGNYPGEKELKNWIELLEDIIAEKNRKVEKFLNEFLEYEDELYELYNKQAEVEDFFTTAKKSKFDLAREKIAEVDGNTGYLGEIKNTEAYNKLLEITNDTKPYLRIREIDDYVIKVKDAEEKIIEKEKKSLIEKAEKGREEIIAIFKNAQELAEKAGKEIKDFIARAKTIKSIKEIMSDRKALENIFTGNENSYRGFAIKKIEDMRAEAISTLSGKEDTSDLINEINNRFDKITEDITQSAMSDIDGILNIAQKDKEQFILQGEGKAKKRARMSLNRIRISPKYNIETEKDAQEYLESIEKQLEELRAKMKEAIKENKIVDIM